MPIDPPTMGGMGNTSVAGDTPPDRTPHDIREARAANDGPYVEADGVFQRALRDHPECLRERWYLFAGRPSRVRIVGSTLASYLDDAFAHLVMPAPDAGIDPALRIDLWDERELGLPAPAWRAGDAPEWGVGGGTLASLCGGRIIRHRLAQSTIWLERASGRLLGSVADADHMTLQERGKPLYYLLSMWHNDRGAHVIHAGFVERQGQGVLLVGAGGSGKSTTSLACAAGGFGFLGDDCTAIEAGAGGGFVGHSLYSSPWIERLHLRNFPAFAAGAVHGTREEEDKALVVLPRSRQIRLVRHAPVCAVALPRVVDRPDTTMRPATRGEALLAVGPSSILLFAPSPGADGLRGLAALVRQVPAFWLELGRDLENIPRCVDKMLETLRETTAPAS